MNTLRPTIWTAVLAIAFAGGCVDVGQDRAAFDETIGIASHGAVDVRVTDGLARIVSLDEGSLILWAQAPSLEVILTTEATESTPKTLEIQNCVADAVLTVIAADGTSLRLESAAGETPTTRRWTLPEPGTGPAIWRIASPRATQDAPFRFVVFADVQRRLDGIQDLFGPMAQEPDVHFGLISGDLTSDGSLVDLRKFQQAMKTLPFPLYASPGNHDIGTDEHHFQRTFGRCSFSFDYGGVRVTSLDSASATLAPRVHRRLDDWLTAGRDRLHVVISHIPPLDPVGTRNGAFASRLEGADLLGRLSRGGVDLTIYGHVHSYYVFENAGIEAIITGGGGAIPQRLDGIGRHYLVVEADPARQRFVAAPIRVYPEE